MKGAPSSNEELTDFVVKKTGARLRDGRVHYQAPSTWPVVSMLKREVFAKQMNIPGSCYTHRALHPHIAGKSVAFAFQAPEGIAGVDVMFVCVGDYLRIVELEQQVCTM